MAVRRVLASLLALCLSVAVPLHATVVARLGFEELVSRSPTIFIGQVTAHETLILDDDLPHTAVTFHIETLVKGDSADDELTLLFLGGETEDLVLDVAGQFIPAIGERGLYFVNTSGPRQVNPLTGWSQGYFPLLGEPGLEFLDLRDHPDYTLLLGYTAPLAGKMKSLRFSDEAIAQRFPADDTFPLADFIAAIRDILATQGD